MITLNLKRNARAMAFLAFASAVAFTSSGCHEDNLVENHHTDDSYIRLPDEKEARSKTVSGLLFPLQVGDHWENIIQDKTEKSVEQVAISGTTTIGGVTGAVMETNYEGKNVREEVYHAEPKGDVSLMAMGTKDNLLTMSPPIPILNNLATDGATMSWSGIIHFKNTSSTASALSRISGHETVSTPAGKFNCSRVDTMIITTINGQTVPIPSRRWLAPGVGAVQSIVFVGNQRVMRQLRSYSVTKK